MCKAGLAPAFGSCLLDEHFINPSAFTGEVKPNDSASLVCATAIAFIIIMNIYSIVYKRIEPSRIIY